jgi:RNA polymerase sigma-70 factor (ECF subfamily)
LRIAEFATGNRDDALDLVQEAMMKLAAGYADHDEQAWAPLFHRILQSRINDWHRRNRVRNRFRVWLKPAPGDESDASAVDALQTAVDHQCPDTPDHVQRSDAMARLDQALRALPLRQQQAFLLRTWEGLDVAATAAAMACSEGSVKTHYSRAIHTLREQLGEHWP